MKPILSFSFFGLLLFCTLSASAQFEYQWGLSIGSDHTDRATGMALDADGNIFVAGMYSNTVDFDPGQGVTELSGNLNEAFLSKYDPNGALIWVRGLNLDTDQTSPNQLPDLDVDENGNSYVISYLGNALESSTYFARYDMDGNLSWEYEIQGTDTDVGWAIHVLPSGDCLLAGRFSGTKDFNPGIGDFEVTSQGNEDLFIAKYDKTGALIWVKNIGGVLPSQTKINHIISDTDNNFYIAGELHKSFDFDPQDGTTTSEISVDGRKAFIAKYDENASFIWAKSIGTIGSAFVSEIVVDQNNDLLITGRFSTAIDFDPSADSLIFNSQGLLDGFLAKYTAEAELIWGFPIGTTGTDEGISLAVDAQNNVHLTGFFGGMEGVDLDPSTAEELFQNEGVYDMYYGLYDTDGNYIDAFSIGGADDVETGIGLEVDAAGTIVIAGWYHSENVDFDISAAEDIRTAELADWYVVKYRHPNIPTPIIDQEWLTIATSPNPVQVNAPIYFDLPSPDQFTIAIIDINGKLVSPAKEPNAVKSPVDPGMYFLLFYKNGFAIGSQKLVVMQ